MCGGGNSAILAHADCCQAVERDPEVKVELTLLRIRSKVPGCTPHGLHLVFICCSGFQNILLISISKQEERTV